MFLKSLGAKILAKKATKSIKRWASKPIETQQKVFQKLITQAKNTSFGKDHDFQSIKTHQDFVKRVTARDYEGLKEYFERTANGEENVLWKGKPTYIAKTSGTTSGTKYIPITKQSMPSHIEAAKNALLCYIEETGNVDFVNGKMSKDVPQTSYLPGVESANLKELFPDFINNVDFIVSIPNESGWYSKFKANSIANNLSLYIKQFYNKNMPVKQFLKKTMKTNMKFLYRNQRHDFFIENPDVYCVTPDSNFERKTVLLVDDIITSGATMGSCLKKITSSGGKVYCFAAAQTMS